MHTFSSIACHPVRCPASKTWQRVVLRAAPAGDAQQPTSSTGSESDPDEEQSAKNAVLELLRHPEEVARQLRAAATGGRAGQGRGNSKGDGRASVSLAWIQALVEAATRGDIGTKEHQRQHQQEQEHEQEQQQQRGRRPGRHRGQEARGGAAGIDSISSGSEGEGGGN